MTHPIESGLINKVHLLNFESFEGVIDCVKSLNCKAWHIISVDYDENEDPDFPIMVVLHVESEDQHQVFKFSGSRHEENPAVIDSYTADFSELLSLSEDETVLTIENVRSASCAFNLISDLFNDDAVDIEFVDDDTMTFTFNDPKMATEALNKLKEAVVYTAERLPIWVQSDGETQELKFIEPYWIPKFLDFIEENEAECEVTSVLYSFHVDNEAYPSEELGDCGGLVAEFTGSDSELHKELFDKQFVKKTATVIEVFDYGSGTFWFKFSDQNGWCNRFKSSCNGEYMSFNESNCYFVI